jgi:hypothetical protein
LAIGGRVVESIAAMSEKHEADEQQRGCEQLHHPADVLGFRVLGFTLRFR